LTRLTSENRTSQLGEDRDGERSTGSLVEEAASAVLVQVVLVLVVVVLGSTCMDISISALGLLALDVVLDSENVVVFLFLVLFVPIPIAPKVDSPLAMPPLTVGMGVVRSWQ
jgi:hypothetical protein